ncbi:YjjG family noncanonical pyrimidine nucleotidase [Bacteroidia bacterium]|jgi:putative hydrolase of the HAD superfamily|nr:YjjG family noncanonical pyrimidine nucleotidase [Bacteroidia bacterium]
MPKNIFFDLDHTLWDFDANAEETLRELYQIYQIRYLSHRSEQDFLDIYVKNNSEMWKLYRKNQVTKEVLRSKRFVDTFREMGVDEEDIPMNIWEKYLEICPTKTILIDGARDLLDYLAGKYNLHLITNGFAEVQRRKLKNSDLGKYFKTLTISEEVGKQKPHPLVFETALKNAAATEKTSHYVGDNLEADIKGAISSGWKAYWYTKDDSAYSHKDCTAIKHLKELKEIF